MARTSTADPLEKFRFQVYSLTGDTIVYSTAGSTSTVTITDPNGNAITPKSGLFPITAGFHDCQVPKHTTTRGVYREGNFSTNNTVFPGLTNMEDIVLSRGVIAVASGAGTNSPAASSQFYIWASSVYAPHDSTNLQPATLAKSYINSSSSSFRQDLAIMMFDRTGTAAKGWFVYNAWPTHFAPGSDLNAGEDGEKSMEALTLAYEDFVEINSNEFYLFAKP